MSVGLKNDKMNVCMNVNVLSLNIFRFTVCARNMRVMKQHIALCNLSMSLSISPDADLAL